MDGVILLHGIARKATSMSRIEQALSTAGYRTLNLDYPSRSADLQGIVQALDKPIADFSLGIDGKLHFVTHSMGGLVARVLITRNRPANLGRVVMLAPPNEGSEIADFLQRNPLYTAFFGPAGRELTTTRTAALRASLGAIDYPLGVIAGDRSLYPLESFLLLPRPNDGRVSVARTHSEGVSDHITIHTSHPLILRNQEAIGQALNFLRDGCFRR